MNQILGSEGAVEGESSEKTPNDRRRQTIGFLADSGRNPLTFEAVEEDANDNNSAIFEKAADLPET